MTDTAEFLACALLLIGAICFAAADRIVERLYAADLQDRINRAKWPNKGA